ncbi:hypothetical protein CH302_19475 [Rhodococcus sp. 15-2388-1-1a]|uniref:DUF6551 family protein n=1 Tax=Nocardiaceae TaxID=85025 RepID=UPI0009E8F9D9|nr:MULTISPECIES: DUF6551 family protein [Rhodococcus]OZE95122.1 hypothetical protein CH302_19475 [Rhodococcus sp. 15-2388-1-1a]
MTAPTTFPMAVSVTDLFVDHTYQRDCDMKRVRKIVAEWDPRLLGVLDVSDRGDDQQPRYAIINGQHRWAAAGMRDPDAHLVVNVHTGLDVAGEAQLFDDIDRKTKPISTWDRWRARKAAGDPDVTTIETAVAQLGLVINPRPGPKNLRCITSLEKLLRKGGQSLVVNTLFLITDTWPPSVDALEGAIVAGVGILLDSFDDVEAGATFKSGRLADAMAEMTPRQVRAQAQSLREFESGTLASMVAVVLVRLYNKERGPKLDEKVIKG